MEITDKVRLTVLLYEGYLPREETDLFRSFLVAFGENQDVMKHLIDYCLARGYGPAYWKYPPPFDPSNPYAPRAERLEMIGKNGLIFVRGCDRDRIDMLLADGRQINAVIDQPRTIRCPRCGADVFDWEPKV